jgi:hypothetical protein
MTHAFTSICAILICILLMKNKISSICVPVLLSAQATIAQIPFNTKDSININKINATVLVHGDMWWDPVAQVAACEFPTGSKGLYNVWYSNGSIYSTAKFIKE